MGVNVNRKTVTNDEFNEAYKGGKSPESRANASNNRGILRSVTKRFLRSGRLDEDECSSCEMVALWRCLQYHDSTFGQKFTTSLYRFCHWECCRASSKKRHKSEAYRISREELPLVARHAVDEHDTWSEERYIDIEQVDSLDEIFSRLEKLPYAWQKNIVKQYYLLGLSHEEIGFMNGGYSKETARLKLDQALSELKLSCQSV